MRLKAFFTVATGIALVGALVVLFLDEKSTEVTSATASAPRLPHESPHQTIPTITFNEAIARLPRIEPHAVHSYNTFQNSDDLLALYRQLVTSHAGEDLITARQILQECRQLASKTNDYYQVANGLPHKIIDARVTDRQAQAARDIISRCKGFLDWKASDFTSALSSLAISTDSINDVATRFDRALKSDAPVPKDLLRDVIKSHDPYSLLLAERPLTSLWRQTLQTPITRQEFLIARSGFEFAGCDLGVSCSATSLVAMIQCVHHDSLCGLTVDQQFEGNRSAIELQKMKMYRSSFADALRAQDIATFGL